MDGGVSGAGLVKCLYLLREIFSEVCDRDLAFSYADPISEVSEIMAALDLIFVNARFGVSPSPLAACQVSRERSRCMRRCRQQRRFPSYPGNHSPVFRRNRHLWCTGCLSCTGCPLRSLNRAQHGGLAGNPLAACLPARMEFPVVGQFEIRW